MSRHDIICISTIDWDFMRPGGLLIGSVPFMYPVHGDPIDFQRFTSEGLSRLLGLFPSVDVRPMGGYFGSLGNGFFFVARKA